MKNLLILLLILLCSCNPDKGINEGLKKQLDDIYYKDQTLRALFDTKTTEVRKNEILKEFGYTQDDFLKNPWGILIKQDSINLKAIKNIIKEHGYPGKSLVGEPTNEAAWYVIQHSDQIEHYFPMIQKAGEEDQLPKTLIAKMQDRLLTRKGELQLYGTQGGGMMIKNPKTGKDSLFRYILPIKNPEAVNQRRKEVGFKTTIEEHAQSMEIEYIPYTQKEIDSIVNNGR